MEGKSEKRLFSGIFYLSLIFGAIICAFINRMALSGVMIQVSYALILGAVFFVLLHSQEDMLWKQIPEKMVYLLTFSVSLCLIGVSSRYNTGMLWMLPLTVVGCLQAMEIKIVTFGMLMAVYLCNALMVHEQIGLMFFYLVMGTSVLLMMSMLRRRREMPYAGVILIALCLVLLVLRCGFDFQEIWRERYYILLEVSSLVFLLLFCMAIQLFRRESAAGEEQITPSTGNETASQEEELILLLDDGFELMQKIRENQELYQHSYKISRISGDAAEAVGCDAILARAGGMYHEAGRIMGQENYMEANMSLSRKYHFPAKLVDVIRQHNTGSEIPQSPEAAIVMLSDCIVSTGEYLQKSGKRGAISNEKLVKSIFSNRVAKGSLEESGLSSGQLDELEKYYIEHVFEEKD